jgi:hypothetical protein
MRREEQEFKQWMPAPPHQTELNYLCHLYPAGARSGTCAAKQQATRKGTMGQRFGDLAPALWGSRPRTMGVSPPHYGG